MAGWNVSPPIEHAGPGFPGASGGSSGGGATQGLYVPAVEEKQI